MATEKKLKDPAEAALSAIEQALSLDALMRDGGARAEPRLPDVGDAEPLLDGARDASGRLPLPASTSSVRRAAHAADAGPAPGLRPAPPDLDRPRREGGLLPPDRSLVANDDRRNIGILQQTLRVRPSRKPYVAAVGAAWPGWPA